MIQRELMHHFHHSAYALHRRVRQDAMPKGENMTRATSGALQDIANLPAKLGHWGEESSRVQVPLHGDVCANSLPTLIQRNAPVQSNDCPTRLAHLRQQGGSPRAKVDD